MVSEQDIINVIVNELKPLKNFYQKFVKTVDSDTQVEQYDEWLALYDSNIICMGIVDYNGANKALYESIQNNVTFDIDFISYEFLSLLHELGHLQTLEDYEDYMNKEYTKEYNRLVKSKTDIYDFQVEYYKTIVVEKVANEWASEYINNNKDFITKLMKIEKQIINKYCYKVNKKLLKKYNIFIQSIDK